MHSDWGDWLPRAVEETTPEGLAGWYLGCNGFFLKASDGTTVLIDPYLGRGDPPRTVRMVPVPFAPDDVTTLDAVLVTHEHTDHAHGPSQAPILANTGADYYAPDDSIAVAEGEDWTGDWGVEESQFLEVAEGESFEVGGLTVHVAGANDPDATHPVSYVVEYGGRTFFHGGDARPGQPFVDVGKRFDIDLGVLAFGSAGMVPDKETGEPTYTQWYSNENMVIEAAHQLGLDRLLPSHWDMWKGLTADPRALHDHARSFDRPQSLEIVEIGDHFEV